jgi:hypothetical protein
LNSTLLKFIYKEVNEIMNKKMFRILALSVFTIFTVSIIVSSAAAAGHKGPAFICPVLGGKAGENPNSPWQNIDHPNYGTRFASPPGGFYTILGPVVNVPMHATNDNGAGSPGGPFLSPGDGRGYSPIWWTP